MAKFYRPNTTKGIYTPGANRLTVNYGDGVTIGLSVGVKKEFDDIRVSLSDEDALLAVYDAGPLKREYEIDTSKPGRYTLTAERDMRTAVPPLEIRVRMPAIDFNLPEGQKDANGCWLACLNWWIRVLVVSGDRVPFNTADFYTMKFSRNGTINYGPLQTGIRNFHSRLRMKTEVIQPSQLRDYMGTWPMIIGFRTPAGYGHMNGLYAYDDSSGTVSAMEPWFPEPTLTDDGLYFEDADAMTGLYIDRPLSYYQNTPKGAPGLFVGYPEEYAVPRMP